MKPALVEKTIVKSCIASIFFAFPIVTPVVIAGLVPSAVHAAVVNSISVQGNQMIPSETIRDFTGVVLGSNLPPEEVNLVLRRLYDSGMFENVEINISGSTMVISVVENPTISVIAFEGNTAVRDEVLASLVSSGSRRPFNRLTAEADAARIAQYYAEVGRVGATVRPVIISVGEGRVNLVYEVSESPVAGIDRISFLGNNAFSDRRLRGVVESDETGFLSFLLGRQPVDPAFVDRDRQLLTEYYTNRGYIDFQVLSAVPELNADQSAYYLTYTLNEGFKYDFGNAIISSDIDGVDAADYERYVRIRSGKAYNASDIRDVIEDIETEAVRRGFPFLRVSPQFTRDQSQRIVDVDFRLVNSRQIYVERIDIVGNTSTVERVIRRQFDFVEGDAFNARKLSEASDKLRALGIFGNASVTLSEGSTPDRAIVNVEVEETATGSLGFALGYSSDNGINGSIQFAERNFLGRGQSFSFDLSVAENSNVLSFQFYEPALFGRDVGAGVNVYYRDVTRSESSFQTTNIGIEPSARFALGEYTDIDLRYRLSLDEIRDFDAGASPYIIADGGERITSSLAVTLSYDRLNSPVEPTGGYRLSLQGEYAGLGGDVNYVKTVAKARAYTSLFDESMILSAELEAGALSTTDPQTRVIDRFFLGGQTLRGFATGGIGPRDSDDALGGNFYSVLRLKSSFPIGFPDDYGIFGGAFVEAGSVWGLDNPGAIDDESYIRASAGLSLFWTTPIGPLEFSYAIPFETQTDDVTQNFSVSVSTRF